MAAMPRIVVTKAKCIVFIGQASKRFLASINAKRVEMWDLKTIGCMVELESGAKDETK